MTDKLATIYIWLTLLVSAGAIAIMLLTGDAKEDVSQRDTEQIHQEMQQTAIEESTFYMLDETLPENSLQIFLPHGTQEQYVTVENDYRNKTVYLHIAKQTDGQMNGTYFYDHPVGIHASLEHADLSEDVNEVTLSLQFAASFEYETKYETGSDLDRMYMQLIRPKDKYEKIIVLDAGHGGADEGYTVSGEDEALLLSESGIAYSIAEKAGALLEKEGIHVYYTRTQQENPTEEFRVELANETQADMLISLHADYEEDTSVYGMRTIYNETYFIPDFASADLAYLLLEKVAASTNEKAIGFEAGTEESYLVQHAMIPVAQLNFGYLSNKQEQKLLGREEHIERIAQGICDAVLLGYKEKEK